jgi:hypothetical protein
VKSCARLALHQTEISRRREEPGSMHDIAEHDSEEEGESHASEDCWVDLTIVRNAISVDDLLERPCEFVRLDEGWSHQLLVFYVLNQVDLRAVDVSLSDDVLHLLVKVELELFGTPEETHEDFISVL